MKKLWKWIIFFILIGGTIGVAIFFSINKYVLSFSDQGYYSQVSELPAQEFGLVFGASVLGNSKPSDILADRLKTAAESFQQGKIKQIIVSGDNRKRNYNEPVVMQKYLMGLGIPQEFIHLDYAGFDTYDTLYRARDLFHIKEVTLFTQDFHLKRAMYISKKLGIKTLGIQTNRQYYLAESYNHKREYFARIKAFLEVEILQPEPVHLGDEMRIPTVQEVEEMRKILEVK
ncbi:MAG: hypothetical protein GY828_00250 [Candidatus Gracilibacteria bacterium]|nr:hypothetical protein [Candidatus Gracilibacteria bacterium]